MNSSNYYFYFLFYSPETRTVNLSSVASDNYEFSVYLYEESSNCQADCTREGSDVCDRTCDGYNGCTFPSNKVKDICDSGTGQYDGATNGQVKTYNSTHEVRCCDSTPYKSETEPESNVTVEADDIVRTERIVTINGEQVKMNVISFD